MKKLLTFAFAMLVFLGIANSQSAIAQVYGDFNLERVTNASYEPLPPTGNGVKVFLPSDFWDSYNTKHIKSVEFRDNGYVEYELPFTFRFGGVDRTTIYISANGFITFDKPVNMPATNPLGLFTIEHSFSQNVIAPYWGDHMLRDAVKDAVPVGGNQWVPSSIIVQKVDAKGTAKGKVIIEWKDLNINKGNQAITSSVASFQVILHQSADDNTTQGDIEFAYGTAGKRPGQVTTDNRVITADCSIGIKGDFGILHGNADFINALEFGKPFIDVTSKKTLTTEWQPTGGSDVRFVFRANVRHLDATSWGDGDADMSAAHGGKHFEKYHNVQSRFVTANDVRQIMISVATNVPLDSVVGRQAYHGDVNHDGRFFYYNDPVTGKPVKEFVKKRSKFYTQDIPLAKVANPNQIMFQANELDAALILHYMGVRVPYLPWTLDTVLYFGKKNVPMSEVVVFGTPETSINGNVTIPVIANSFIDGAISARFDVNGDIENIVSISKDNFMATYHKDRAVLAGSSKFESGEVIAYVTYRPNSNNVEVNNIYVNGEEKNNISLTVNNDNDNAASMLSNYPNPFSVSTNIAVNIEKAGYYSLNIYDLNGNLVKSLFNGNINKAGVNPFTWDGTDNSGAKVSSGMYIYRLNGNNVSVSNTLQLVK